MRGQSAHRAQLTRNKVVRISGLLLEPLSNSHPRPTAPLTPKQQRVFDWIAGYIERTGISPAFEEIGEP